VIAERSRAVWLAMGLLTVGSLAGCGLGAGRAPGGVTLTVTRDFGRTSLGTWRAPRVHGLETVMSLLMRNASVTTRYGGGFVQSIDGLSGGHQAGRTVDWFYYVNGSEAPEGAASRNVRQGDRIWWDRHDWSQTDRVPAVVGSFPEPFTSGIAGRRLPVRIECALVAGHACRAVTERLRALAVPAAVAPLAAGSGPGALRLVVAPMDALRADPAAATIRQGPSASGVYVRFLAGGHTLVVLDQDGHPARSLGAGAGLLAATATGQSAPAWFVSGTDAAGVEHAAGAFTRAVLANRFAVAVAPDGSVLGAPQVRP
jgi:Domain of unknown function (DUF4430)